MHIYLLESDVLGVLSEALTAHVQAVFANQTMLVATDPAAKKKSQFNNLT